MIINWFKKNINDYPKFYQTYLESFKNIENKDNYIVFDCEINHSIENESKILKFSAIKIKNQEIIVNDYLEININPNNVIEAEAIIQFLAYIKNYNLVSFQINHKIEIIDKILKKLNAGNIENELIDISILYNTFYKNEINETASLELIVKKLKLSDFYHDTLDEKVFTQALIFIKLNVKLGLKSLF